MQPVVIWGEVLFFIDFSMDFCTLYPVLRILGQPVRLYRLLAASALCAAAGVASVTLPTSAAWILAAGCVFAVWLLLIPRVNRTPYLFLKAVLLFVFLEAAAGGLVTAVFFSLNRWFSGVGISVQTPLVRRQWFWLCAALFFFICRWVNRILQNAAARRFTNPGGSLTVRYDGCEIRAECLLDSGNLVCEPISGRPVTVLPSGCSEALGIDLPRLCSGGYPHSRLIPLQSIGGSQLLWGIHPEQILLTAECGTDGKQTEIDCYIVFSDRTEEAIVPMCLLQ